MLALMLCFSLIAAPLALSGCETYGEAGGLGAGLGAVTGAVIGNQSGHALEGAAIGAVVGGLAGLVAHDIKVHKQRSREETVQDLRYEPSQGLVLKFISAEVLPSVARPGDLMQANFTYALLGAGAGIGVTETRTLLRGDRLLSDLASKTDTRDDGTYVSSQEFRLPNDIMQGIYTLDTRVTAGQNSISAKATFSVQ
ncbi:MAG: glycine zipper family protein [Candidatus Hydrogenedentes bacterium]|nr:glycine zipper family protein [Candidatus Hydrogenedentota bacterium]